MKSEVNKNILKVLSFNTWLLPFGISKDNKIRRNRLIPDLIKENADVYVFQEVWTEYDKVRICREFRKYGYNYNYFTRQYIWRKLRGILGNGLLIISRIPLKGKSNMYFEGFTKIEEYLVNKGAIHCELLFNGISIDIYNTHLGSLGFNPENGGYSETQKFAHNSQLNELREFVKRTSSANVLIIVGDFNWPMKEYNPMKKIFINKESKLIKDFKEALNLKTHLNNHKHTYSNKNPYAIKNTIGGTIDYIMINENQDLINYQSHRVILKEKIPETGKTLSDHYGILATLKIIHPRVKNRKKFKK